MPSSTHHRAETAHASARREPITTVLAQRAAFIAEPAALSLLEAMPGPAFVLNARRQIVAGNRQLSETLGLTNLEDVLGMRPGEAVHCTHSAERPAGCGTSNACVECGAVNAVLECFSSRKRVVREWRVSTTGAADGGALDFRLYASPLTCGTHEFVVVGLQDIRDEKRRQVLERVFFFDLLDVARGVQDAARKLREPGLDAEEAFARSGMLEHLSGAVVEQIEAQRALLAAERGELGVEPSEVDLAELLSGVVASLQLMDVAAGRTLRFESIRRCPIETDPVLCTRAVDSLLRNALEATPPGGTVEITCEYDHEVATVTVHNEGVIPADVQPQIFQRSFTTAGEGGRGIGTYGARLVVERYLGGKVAFMSEARVGTLFLVMLPRRMQARPRA